MNSTICSFLSIANSCLSRLSWPVATFVLCLSSVSLAPVPVWAIRGDYIGDGKADLATVLVDKTAKKTTWSVKDLDAQTATYIFAAPADAFVPADYNGDGKTEPAIVYVRPDGVLEWRTITAAAEEVLEFGVNLDRPLVGDYDCDGKSDRAYASPSGGRLVWHFLLSSGAVANPVTFGKDTDSIYSADMTGRKCDDLVLSRVLNGALQWYYRPIEGSYKNIAFGKDGDRILPPADMDGDGVADLITITELKGVATASIRVSTGSVVTMPAGKSADVPLTGAFSGNSNAEIGFYRRPARASGTGIFYVNTTTGMKKVSLGTRSSYVIRPDGSAVAPGDGVGEVCGKTVSIDALKFVLYKPSNLHGGRGPTFLVQNAAERTNKQKIAVKDMQCRTIAYFGLYRTDYPYGSRYYQASGGGSAYSANQLAALAKKAGSTAILVEGKGKWIKVNNPLNRQGAVHS